MISLPTGLDDAINLHHQMALRGDEQAQLHSQSGARRDEIFGRTVFVRGVIEVSNFCRQNCTYCGMRRENKELERFRLELDVLRKIVFEDLPASITDINFQTGEDPVAVREILLPLIREIRQSTRLGVSVCLGTLEEKLYRDLHDAGADFYIIKLETGNEEHFRHMQAPGTLATRLQAMERLIQAGWLVSSGFIYGLPQQTQAHIAETLQRLADLPLIGTSVSPFIPGLGTPSADHPAADLEMTLNLVSLLRLRHPERIIPAVSAMSILKKNGYERALRAGANLTTINLTPEGSRENYLLYKKDRFIMNERRVLQAVEAAGLGLSAVSLVDHLKSTHP